MPCEPPREFTLDVGAFFALVQRADKARPILLEDGFLYGVGEPRDWRWRQPSLAPYNTAANFNLVDVATRQEWEIA